MGLFSKASNNLFRNIEFAFDGNNFEMSAGFIVNPVNDSYLRLSCDSQVDGFYTAGESYYYTIPAQGYKSQVVHQSAEHNCFIITTSTSIYVN